MYEQTTLYNLHFLWTYVIKWCDDADLCVTVTDPLISAPNKACVYVRDRNYNAV